MTEQQADYITEANQLIGWDRQIEIQDDGDLKKYRIELPNLYDDSDLDPYEFRLLAHYKRVGVCTESTRTTADICKMAVGQVCVKRKSLRKAGFIDMKKIPISPKEFSYKITVLDRWLENFTKYSKRSPDERKRSSGETKNTTTGGEVLSNIFTHYQNNIAMLTPIMADTLQDAEKTYSEAWVMEAIGLAVTNNKRNWRYCEAILKRWKESGKDEGKGKPAEEKKAPELKTVPVRTGVPRPANVPPPNIVGAK
jgi:DnaD/phage-associated family protein